MVAVVRKCNPTLAVNTRPEPDPQRVARRALILATLVCRANIDNQGRDGRDVDGRLRSWFAHLDLADELAPSEATFLQTPFGQLPAGQRISTTWQAEGLLVLAWALGRCDLLPHDQLVDPVEISDSVDLLCDEAAELISAATLRSFEEREAFREIMYALDCRWTALRHAPGARDISSHFDPSWWSVLGLEPPLTADGDLFLDGRPLLEATEDRRQRVGWAVKERHRASIWLLGESESYASTRADT